MQSCIEWNVTFECIASAEFARIISATIVFNNESLTFARNATAFNATTVMTVRLGDAKDVVERSVIIVSKKMERLGKGRMVRHFAPLALRWKSRRAKTRTTEEEIRKMTLCSIARYPILNLEAGNHKYLLYKLG